MNLLIQFLHDFSILIAQYKSQTLTILVGSFAGGFVICSYIHRQRREELSAKKRILSLWGGAEVKNPQTIVKRTNYLFPKMDQSSEEHLYSMVRNSKQRIRIFGLTRNFYTTPDMRREILRRAEEIPIDFYLMNPMCFSRADRYRVEPPKAAFESISRYIDTVESVFLEMIATARSNPAKKTGAGIRVYYYNFPCQLSAEQFDDIMRHSIYGIHEQGDASPIWLSDYTGDNDYRFINRQIDFVEQLAQGRHTKFTQDRGLSVVGIEEEVAARAKQQTQGFISYATVLQYLSSARVSD